MALRNCEPPARMHGVAVDRPVAKGGTDQGPLSGEYLLVAPGVCFLSNVLASARAGGLELSGARVVATGSIADSLQRFGGIVRRGSGTAAGPFVGRRG